MNNFNKLFSVLVILSTVNRINAQVTISGSNGNANGIYASVKLAFDAINLVSDQTNSNIVININSKGYISNSENITCVLRQPVSASWNSLKIIPSGYVTISGSVDPGNPLIDLNGADNVIIDGLNSDGNTLTISNSTVSSTSGTSTIRFKGDAIYNSINNCTLLGSASMTSGIDGGTVFFSGDAVLTGNDNNTISNCNIGPAGTNLPTKGIYSNGTSVNELLFNSQNTISGCNIYDYFGAEVQSSGVYITGGSREFLITSNKFFQTSQRIQIKGSVHTGIKISGLKIKKCMISENIIGFSSSSGTGMYNFEGVSSSSRFYPICINTQVIDTTNIQGNIISNINCSGFISGKDTSSPFAAILVIQGKAYIGNLSGNIIGSTGSPGVINYNSSGKTIGEIYGILYSDTNSVCNISNNMIGGISGGNGSSGGLIIYGIRANSSSHLLFKSFINRNTVGNSDALISNTSQSPVSRVIGIYSNQGPCDITNNTVSFLKSVSPNSDKGSSSSVLGIGISNLSRNHNNIISQNTLIALTSTNNTSAVSVTGISYSGADSGSHFVSGNIIHSFDIVSGNELSTLNGIFIERGFTTYQNNFISLGIDVSGNSIEKNIIINGINETTEGSDNIYFNSIYIGGSGVGPGNANTYAFNSSIKFNLRKYRSNIFCNARSNGSGSGFHYAVKVGGSVGFTGGLTMFNNLYFVSGNGGVFGYFNHSSIENLSDWQDSLIGPGQDVLSYYGNPQFENPNISYKIRLDTNSIANNNGFPFVTVRTDIEGNPRSHFMPDLGAYEFTGTFILKLTVSLQVCQFDEISVSLIDDFLCVPYKIITVYLSGGNTVLVHFAGIPNPPGNAPLGWVSVKNKSSLKIWSKQVLGFERDGTAEYNFTSSQTQEYSSNLIFNGSYWTMIAGDINQDDVIDMTDLTGVNDDANSQIPGSVSGFTGTDINCDGYTDATDQAVVDNNSALNPQEIPPCP